MIRKGTIILIAALFLLLAALAYIIQQKKGAVTSESFEAVPLDAGIVIELIDFPSFVDNLLNDNNLFAEMDITGRFMGLNKSLSVIDSLARQKEFRALFGSPEVLISFHLIGRDKVIPLFISTLPPEIREKHLKEALSGLRGISFSESDYQGYRMFNLSKGGKELFHTVNAHGLLIFSRSDILVESALRQLDSPGDIRDLPGFASVAGAAGKNENKLFLLYDKLDEILALIGKKPGGALLGNINDLASCSEADIYLKKDALTISGYIEASDTSYILNKFLRYEPSSFESYMVIPSGAAMFESLVGYVPDPSNRLTGDRSLTYIADVIRPQLEGEVTKINLGLQGQDPADNWLIIFRLKGRSATENAFVDELAGSWENLGTGQTDFVIKYNPDDQTEYNLYRLPGKKLASMLYPGFTKGSSCSYATFYDNWLVLSSMPEALTKFIYDNILSRTLANDLGYREFEETMPSRAGYFFYAVPSKILPLLDGVFNEAVLKGLNENINSLNRAGAIGFQLMESNGMLYHTLSLSYNTSSQEKATTQWESLLDTVAGSKPMFFTNHYTGRNEIFLQDKNNNVYLINSAGRILWKIPMDEKITGIPYMIDYYRNGKYQILFSTRNKLHLLDRNGNYVERYPVSLRSPATNGLALFDYENNRNYRLFIAGEDRKLYAYDKSGSIVRGWQQFRTNGVVTSPLEFFRVSGKDYIVANDESDMYILDRRGNIRVNVNEQVSRAKRSTLRLSGGPSPSLVLSSNGGEVKIVSFNGEVETRSAGEFSSDHVFESFDIDGDGVLEYFYFDNERITAFDDNMSRLFTKNVNSDRIIGPWGLVFSSNDRKIGFVDPNNGKIHVLDIRGKEAEGFPLPGNTPFSVGKFSSGSSYNLITGGNDSFIYNYEISR